MHTSPALIPSFFDWRELHAHQGEGFMLMFVCPFLKFFIIALLRDARPKLISCIKVDAKTFVAVSMTRCDSIKEFFSIQESTSVFVIPANVVETNGLDSLVSLTSRFFERYCETFAHLNDYFMIKRFISEMQTTLYKNWESLALLIG